MFFYLKTKFLICQAKMSLFSNNVGTWIMRETRFFDVSVGSYDRVGICELVGNFILDKFSEKHNKRILVYISMMS